MLYVVEVSEIWKQEYLVEAESKADAIAAIDDGNVEAIESGFEFSHHLEPTEGDVREATKEDEVATKGEDADVPPTDLVDDDEENAEDQGDDDLEEEDKNDGGDEGGCEDGE